MRRYLTAIALVVLLLTPVLAFSGANAASPNISRSYESTTPVPNGSLVSLVSGKTGYVEEANTSNEEHLVGVAVVTNQSLIAVNPSTGNIQVATTGTVNALVSTVNGNIGVGQEIAVSPFNGVGMKAIAGDRVIGTALTSFNPNTAGATSEQVTDSAGNKHDLTIGFVKLTISVGTMNSSNFSIQSLQQFVESLTGHPISVLRIIISLLIAFVAILAIVVLTYASIYGSIVSIGRNPLAKYAVFRTLTSVIGMVTFIAGVASATIYFLLY
ncbi:MAG TPA: hypothetical protein VGF75_00215 [Candidatus Saccharimonadales bacterium]|jgi:hypothetical protein